MPSLLKCSSQSHCLILKRLGPRKPHNSAVVGILLLPVLKKIRQFQQRPCTVMYKEWAFGGVETI